MGIEVIDSSSNTIMTKTTFDENFINSLQKGGISVVPVFDEFNKIHIRIAIQDKKTNQEFIKVFTKIFYNIKYSVLY